jgi:hypothetical protein
VSPSPHMSEPESACTLLRLASLVCPAQRADIHAFRLFKAPELVSPRLALTHTTLSGTRQVLWQLPALSSPYITVRPEPELFNWAIAPNDEIIGPMGYQPQPGRGAKFPEGVLQNS